MKANSKISSIVSAAILACLIVGGAGSAFAGTTEVHRTIQEPQAFTGECCVSFNEAISITEPATLVPVIVDWNTDYGVNVADSYLVGLSVNGGACQTLAWGPRGLADNPGPDSPYPTAASFQWIILPSDGVLVKGKNTFEVCGGGQHSTDDSISFGDNTLTAQLGANYEVFRTRRTDRRGPQMCVEQTMVMPDEDGV
jgi:hypothetical protein